MCLWFWNQKSGLAFSARGDLIFNSTCALNHRMVVHGAHEAGQLFSFFFLVALVHFIISSVTTVLSSLASILVSEKKNAD